MKKIIITILIIGVLGFGGYFLVKSFSNKEDVTKVPTGTTSTTTLPTNEQTNATSTAVQNKEMTVIGKSVNGRDILAYHYGTGDTELLLVGGIHGGYSWNTALVAYQAMDYLKANGAVIPANIKVTIIPVLNPDGLYKVTGLEGRFTPADVSASQAIQTSGRFNANNIDLNRNFDCDWKSIGKWQNTNVSGGSSVFSEPESLAVKNYVETHTIAGALVWYSAAGGVYASSCGGAIMPETSAITNAYAKASGYKAYNSFDAYETSGDMVKWLAKKSIPAISVLLTTHTDTEWTKNKNGIDALLKYYTK